MSKYQDEKDRKKRGYHIKTQRLTADAVRSFSELFLQSGYDGNKPTPAVHDEWWEMCCDLHPRVAIAAPRGHAKTTAITLAYTLANVSLRYKKFVVIVGDTEKTAIGFLSNIRDQLRENKEMKEVFGIKRLSVDGATECTVEFTDGSKARIMARGAGQPVRGLLWKNTRPDLIVIDDLDNDEAVSSKDRREKLDSWLIKALFPVLSKERGQIRWVGTILHDDSALANRMSNGAWKSKLYKAHESFSDFSNLLWPEYWTEDNLRLVRQEFIDSGDPEGYSQEYLNDPSDLQNPFFRDEDFIPMNEDDKAKPKTYYVGCDFALSDKSHSDYTVFTVGGYDSDGVLHIVDERAIRTNDTAIIVDELFSIMGRWNPDMYIFEGGVIAYAVEPMFKLEMRKRNKFSSIHTYTPIMDKKLRAASIQQRMRSGGVRHDTDAHWFEDHKAELRSFPKGKRKDRVDSIAWLGRGIDEFVEAPTEDEYNSEQWQTEYDNTMLLTSQSSITGY